MPGAVARTTLTLPADLLERVDRAVRQGRAALDAEFAGMAEDEAYLAESRRIDAEFAAPDAEAFRAAPQLV